MTLDEIFEEVYTRSGQFIVAPEDLEIDTTRFKYLVRSVLRNYNEYHPWTSKFNLEVPNFQYEFTSADDNGIPYWVSDVVPVRLMGNITFAEFRLWEHDRNVYANAFTELTKDEFVWRYEKPVLHVPYNGTFDITAHYYHEITTNDQGKDEVTTLDFNEDTTFFDLLTGRFMQILGSYRGAFIPQEIPVQINYQELKSDGKEMEDRALERLREQDSIWYRAMA